ncbi:hypothetical protein ACFOEE_06565 [Pseudoalteromonas fenneropenaei]|uniref:Uncharacterized protein n=1 Tax=Pseudoalteromonas fenneropenaei TaxID=1737459 RepID=A0ABV7CHQ7_9GAMM
MSNFKLRLADELGIQPAKIVGMEQHGLGFFTWHDSGVVGGQCSCCHTIIWVSPMKNSILAKTRPEHIPSSGEEYRTYYKDTLNRFLCSLPPCPNCGKREFDRFINNTSFPRLQDGFEFDENQSDIALINSPPFSVKVWWLDEN